MCIKLVYKLIYETIYILKDMSWKLLWLSGDTKNICQISIKKNITCNSVNTEYLLCFVTLSLNFFT